MTDDKKTPAKRAPRKRAKPKSPTRSPDAAQRNPGPAASDAQPTKGSETRKAQPRKQPGATAKAAGKADEIKTTTSAPSTDTAASARQVLATIPIHVRWRDLDAFNHVNNSSYLTFLEESRLQWLRGVPGDWFGEHAMPVMASVELHYRKSIAWPAEVDVQLRCERMGNSSLTIGNRIVDRNDSTCVYSEGKTVMVWVDPASGTSVPLPEAIRQACSA